MERELLETKVELDTARSQRDALKFAHDELLKSSESQVSELKDKVKNLEQQLDGEYKFGLTFSYNCIMSVLKKEYPELNMHKLVASVNKYMEEHNQRVEGQEGTLLVIEEQYWESTDEVPNKGIGMTHSFAEVTGPPFAVIVDPPVESV